jgi:hypothetical protein
MPLAGAEPTLPSAPTGASDRPAVARSDGTGAGCSTPAAASWLQSRRPPPLAPARQGGGRVDRVRVTGRRPRWPPRSWRCPAPGCDRLRGRAEVLELGRAAHLCDVHSSGDRRRPQGSTSPFAEMARSVCVIHRRRHRCPGRPPHAPRHGYATARPHARRRCEDAALAAGGHLHEVSGAGSAWPANRRAEGSWSCAASPSPASRATVHFQHLSRRARWPWSAMPGRGVHVTAEAPRHFR